MGNMSRMGKGMDFRRVIGLGVIISTLAGTAILAPAALAKIVVGEGIAGVKLGMTQLEVEKAIGPPGFKEPPDFQGLTSWKYPKGFEGVVGFDHQLHVNGMWTDSKRQKTSKGIGPFSSYAKFRKAYPKLKCGPGPWIPKKSLDCEIKGQFQGKRVVTSILFYTKALGVREIDINYVS
jgi:hypothetical protein